jgi:hypothetical protein
MSFSNSGAIVLRTNPLSPRQRIRLALLEMLPKNSIGAEIGVSAGDFSQEILNVLAPRELVLIDPWDLLGAQHTEDSRRWCLNTAPTNCF